MRIGIWCDTIRYHTAVCCVSPALTTYVVERKGAGNLVFSFLFLFRMGYNDGIMAWFPTR